MKGPKMQIKKSLLKEIQSDANHLKNIERATAMFDNLDSKINQIGKLIEKLPDNASVRPKQSWLNIFGIEK